MKLLCRSPPSFALFRLVIFPSFNKIHLYHNHNIHINTSIYQRAVCRVHPLCFTTAVSEFSQTTSKILERRYSSNAHLSQSLSKYALSCDQYVSLSKETSGTSDLILCCSSIKRLARSSLLELRAVPTLVCASSTHIVAGKSFSHNHMSRSLF